MSLSVIYSLFDNEKKFGPILSKVATGIAVSFVGVIIMRNHVLLENGLVFDGRSVLMLLTALYFGLLPSIIGGVSLIGYRYYLTILYDDSSGLVPGILWIVIPIIIGLVWRVIRLKKNNKLNNLRYFEQFGMIFLTQTIVISVLFLFPSKVSLETIFKVAPTLIIFYPLGGFAVSLFMFKLRKNYINQATIKRREKEYFELFNSGSYCNFLIDPITNYIVNANEVAIILYGYSVEEFKNTRTTDISVYGSLELKHLIDRDEHNADKYFVSKHRLKNGDIIDVEIRKRFIFLDEKEYIYANVIDISQRTENDQKYKDVNEKLKVTLKGVTDGIIVVDEYGSTELVNDVGLQFLISEDYIGKNITSILNIEKNGNQMEFYSVIENLLEHSINYKNKKPYILFDRFSTKHYIDFSITQITYDKESNHKGAILVINDVTEKHIETNQIHYISQHDHLTGLYNRYFFDEELSRLDTKRQLPISLIMGDINGLKIVNDTYGHFEGDKYIKEISNILIKATRAEDIVARWGGDEFIILLPQTASKEALIVINRINDLCEKSRYDIVTPSISIGLATKSSTEQDVSTVMTLAEERMYSNKQTQGKILRSEILDGIYKRINNLHPDLETHAKTIEVEALEFARYLKLDDEDIKSLSSYAKYHDIGWITVQKDMIDTDTKLFTQDLSFTKKHPEIGFRIMKSIPELSHLAELIEAHQEQYDGKGVPNGLKGKEIPYLSRILAIIDFIDTNRTRDILYDEIVKELSSESSKKFDPELVQKYIEMKKENN
jgi:diguanylate cyclase (GGDEF)-like protein/PAS domain S-box-containing protein